MLGEILQSKILRTKQNKESAKMGNQWALDLMRRSGQLIAHKTATNCKVVKQKVYLIKSVVHTLAAPEASTTQVSSTNMQ